MTERKPPMRGGWIAPRTGGYTPKASSDVPHGGPPPGPSSVSRASQLMTEHECRRCGHDWFFHDGRDERIPGDPCCVYYAGMGEPCGCESVAPEGYEVDPRVVVVARVISPGEAHGWRTAHRIIEALDEAGL